MQPTMHVLELLVLVGGGDRVTEKNLLKLLEKMETNHTETHTHTQKNNFTVVKKLLPVHMTTLTLSLDSFVEI